MTQYIVHLFREMRLDFVGIEAETPHAAAAIAADKPTDAADNIEDCDGDNLAAVVDAAGDEDHHQSTTIDFEPERVRKMGAKLLAALEALMAQADEDCPIDHRSRHFLDALADAHTAINEARAVPITPVPRADSPRHRFEIEHNPLENPDRAYVMVDDLFDVAIIRTAEGIVVDIYPKDWIEPIDTMTVWDEQVAATHDDDQ